MIRTSSGVRFGCAGPVTAQAPEAIEENKKHNGRRIRQYSIDGHLVDEWQSIHEAARATKTTRSNIIRAINGESKTAGGFRWCYADDDYMMQYITAEAINQSMKRRRSRRGIPIAQYSLDGQLIRIWNSTNEAADYMEISKTAISLCVSGKSKTSHGYIWKRANREEESEK